MAGCALLAGGLRASEQTGPGDVPGPASSTTDATEAVALIEIVTTAGRGRDRLRIDALVTTERISRVDFLLDGDLIGRDRRFPFGTVIEQGEALTSRAAAGHLEGVAYDQEGREIARDGLQLERGEPGLALSLSPVRRLDQGDWLEVVADVRHPAGVAIERVDFYRDDHYVASVSSAPYRVRIPAGPPRQSGDAAPGETGGEASDYLRAVALTDEGDIAEGIRLLRSTGESDVVSVSLIELYAMVTTRGGEPVTGLPRDSFALEQGGRELAIDRFVEGDSVPLSLALVIDGSGSMFDNLERAKLSARDFLTATLDEGDEALLVDFDTRPRLLQGVTGDVETLVSRFDDIRSRGGSAIYDAILFATLQLEAHEGRRALVILTDGLDSDSRIPPKACALLARGVGVPVFVLGLAAPYDTTPSHHVLALRELAASSGGSFYQVRRNADIPAAYDAIETQLRGQYLVGFSSDAPLSGAELDSLTLRVADQRLQVRTILGGQVRVMD